MIEAEALDFDNCDLLTVSNSTTVLVEGLPLFHGHTIYEITNGSLVAKNVQKFRGPIRRSIFLADRTNGRAIGTVLRLSSVVCL